LTQRVGLWPGENKTPFLGGGGMSDKTEIIIVEIIIVNRLK
jgi:hypothetical protein